MFVLVQRFGFWLKMKVMKISAKFTDGKMFSHAICLRAVGQIYQRTTLYSYHPTLLDFGKVFGPVSLHFHSKI